MIEQYTITTTPKYSFPQPTINATLPKCFTEQSIISLKLLRRQPFHLDQLQNQQDNMLETRTQALRLNTQSIRLKPKQVETTVAACDTSTIKIGETSTGILAAIRGATIWKQNKNYRYARFGPFIYHITEDNKRDVFNALERSYFDSTTGTNRSNISLWQMPMRIASLLEKWLQMMLTTTINEGLTLFDGSLTAGTPDAPIQRVKEILAQASKRNNVILAFSKVTNLRVNGYLITDLPLKHKPPFLLETFGLRPKPPITLLGDVYIAKLTKDNYAFRLDIDKETPIERRIEATERLLATDIISQGYPETLRLAHILCTFTANEVLAMQHFTARKFGLKLINRPDMHRLLFGPFGRGENYA